MLDSYDQFRGSSAGCLFYPLKYAAIVASGGTLAFMLACGVPSALTAKAAATVAATKTAGATAATTTVALKTAATATTAVALKTAAVASTAVLATKTVASVMSTKVAIATTLAVKPVVLGTALSSAAASTQLTGAGVFLSAAQSLTSAVHLPAVYGPSAKAIAAFVHSKPGFAVAAKVAGVKKASLFAGGSKLPGALAVVHTYARSYRDYVDHANAQRVKGVADMIHAWAGNDRKYYGPLKDEVVKSMEHLYQNSDLSNTRLSAAYKTAEIVYELEARKIFCDSNPDLEQIRSELKDQASDILIEVVMALINQL